MRLVIGILLIALFVFASPYMYKAFAALPADDPDKVDYHLELTHEIFDTCYSRDADSDKLIPNPALPIFSKVTNTCEKKMKSLDSFLADFVNDENGKRYDKHIGLK